MSENEVHQLFESFNNQTIMVVGDVMIDAYMWGRVERISPEAPVPIMSSSKRENRLGGAANVARNIQALGSTPLLCSVIGDDEKGRIFAELLQNKGMLTDGIVKSEHRPTTVKTRIISDNQHLLRVDEETEQPLDAAIEKEFIEQVLHLLENQTINAVVFEDYDKGTITPKVIEAIVNKANSLNIPTLVDPKKRNFLNYNGVTLFKPNFKELVEGLKVDIEKSDFTGIHNSVQYMHNELQIKFVLVTLSELGVFVSKNGWYQTLPAEVRDVTDVSGAGDTVISVASLCLIAGLPPETIATIANLAGGLVCEKVGVVPIDKELLLKEAIEYFYEK